MRGFSEFAEALKAAISMDGFALAEWDLVGDFGDLQLLYFGEAACKCPVRKVKFPNRWKVMLCNKPEHQQLHFGRDSSIIYASILSVWAAFLLEKGLNCPIIQREKTL